MSKRKMVILLKSTAYTNRLSWKPADEGVNAPGTVIAFSFRNHGQGAYHSVIRTAIDVGQTDQTTYDSIELI